MPFSRLPFPSHPVTRNVPISLHLSYFFPIYVRNIFFYLPVAFCMQKTTNAHMPFFIVLVAVEVLHAMTYTRQLDLQAWRKMRWHNSLGRIPWFIGVAWLGCLFLIIIVFCYILLLLQRNKITCALFYLRSTLWWEKFSLTSCTRFFFSDI